MTADIIDLGSRRQAIEELRRAVKPEMDRSSRMAIGRRFRLVRTALDVTENEAAKVVGASFKTYQRWEKGEGRMRTKHLLAFARTYHTSLDWLADGGGMPFKYPVSAATIQRLKAALAQTEREIDRLNVAIVAMKERAEVPGQGLTHHDDKP